MKNVVLCAIYLYLWREPVVLINFQYSEEVVVNNYIAKHRFAIRMGGWNLRVVKTSRPSVQGIMGRYNGRPKGSKISTNFFIW